MRRRGWDWRKEYERQHGPLPHSAAPSLVTPVGDGDKQTSKQTSKQTNGGKLTGRDGSCTACRALGLPPLTIGEGKIAGVPVTTFRCRCFRGLIWTRVEKCHAAA